MSDLPKMPLVSVITVTYNAADTVAATMRSVASQTATDYEHLVIDGASKDDTLPIIDSLRTPFTVINSSPDHGIYDAMNKGMGLAKGLYVVFLNAGDRFHSPDSLQQIVNAILANNYPGIVYGQTNLVDHEGRYLGPRHLTAPEHLTLKDFAGGMKVCHQAFVAHRRITPLFDTRWRFSADYEWCVRCLQHSRNNIYTGTVLVDYLNEGTTTRNRRASLIERYKIMCHYYGPTATMLRHLAFLPRFICNALGIGKKRHIKN